MGTSLHPIALLAILTACVLIFRLPRQQVIIPFIAAGIIVPLGQKIVIAGMDFYVVRIMVLCAWARILSRDEHRGLEWTTMDKMMLAMAIVGTIAYSIHGGVHSSTWRAFSYRVGSMFLTEFGSYSMARVFIRDLDDIRRLVKALAVIAIVVAAAMLLENRTSRNVFSVFGGVLPVTLVRDGRLRCTGPFVIHILAGTFGASCLPLFWGLWQQGKEYHRIAAVGILAGTIITATSASSGPILTYVAGVGALFLWPLRRRMRLIRWGVLLGLIGLHLAMEAPVWALLGRANVLSASTGFHRYMLVDAFIRNFWQWWLIGTPRANLANWGFFGYLTDITNEFIGVGVHGGLFTLLLYIGVIGYGFQAVGRGMNALTSGVPEQRLLWGFGASLFSHVVSFMGVGYSDQIVVVWYVLLGTLAALAGAAAAVTATAVAANDENGVLMGESASSVVDSGSTLPVHAADSR